MGICIILIGLLAGCAAQKPKAPCCDEKAALHYEPASAGSLVFDPPVISDQRPLELSRVGRDPGAFAGYESITATYFWVWIDDRQTSDCSDRYERRAMSAKVGMSYR